MSIYSKRQIQIKIKAQVRALIFDEVSTVILAEYSNYNNIFLIKNVIKLPEYTEINHYVIKLDEEKQLSFGLIYSPGLIELETLETYIKTNLSNGFI